MLWWTFSYVNNGRNIYFLNINSKKSNYFIKEDGPLCGFWYTVPNFFSYSLTKLYCISWIWDCPCFQPSSTLVFFLQLFNNLISGKCYHVLIDLSACSDLECFSCDQWPFLLPFLFIYFGKLCLLFIKLFSFWLLIWNTSLNIKDILFILNVSKHTWIH